MTCPNCDTKMALTTQYVGPDGKMVRVYTCPQCGFMKKG